MSDDRLEALRAQGAHLVDPVRFRYLEALARRAQSQPAAVQRVLMPRLASAIADYACRVDQSVSRPAVAARSAPQGTALAALNRYLHERSRDEPQDALPGDAPRASEMKSVRRFSEVWSRIAAEQQVSQAVARGPENAGPLNSHRLMLRALRLMKGLSPDYLQRFLSQMDTLLWLEQASRKTAAPEGKSGKRATKKG